VGWCSEVETRVESAWFGGFNSRSPNTTTAFKFPLHLGASISDVYPHYGDVVLFLIPKSAWDGKTRGDGAFQAHECDALPIGTYQSPSGYNFGDLFCGLRTAGVDRGFAFLLR